MNIKNSLFKVLAVYDGFVFSYFQLFLILVIGGEGGGVFENILVYIKNSFGWTFFFVGFFVL